MSSLPSNVCEWCSRTIARPGRFICTDCLRQDRCPACRADLSVVDEHGFLCAKCLRALPGLVRVGLLSAGASKEGVYAARKHALVALGFESDRAAAYSRGRVALPRAIPVRRCNCTPIRVALQGNLVSGSEDEVCQKCGVVVRQGAMNA
jgi:hypothetical protein